MSVLAINHAKITCLKDTDLDASTRDAMVRQDLKWYFRAQAFIDMAHDM